MTSEVPIHILLVSYPAQGHITPLLRLGKCLAAKGFSVIFTTSEKAGKTMRTANNITDKLAIPIGDGSLTFDFFDDDDATILDLDYHARVELSGRNFISEMIKNHADSKKPISCIINNPFFAWVSDVAAQHHIPCALSWIHSSAVFAAYYNYVHNLVPFPSISEPYIDVELPFVVLKYDEVPDFIHPFHPHPIIGELTIEQMKDMSKMFCVLVDTCEELEPDIIDYLLKLSIPVRSIGPLFRNPIIKAVSNVRGDFGKSGNDDSAIIEWINTKPKGSVVYISFGTVVNHSQEQVNEIAYALLEAKVSFLWAKKDHVFPDGFLEETSESGRGRVVKWSPQEQVLAHPSTACYMTHCGWNSTMEAIALGVPVLAFPSFGDHLPNAKFLVDVFGVGVKMGRNGAGKNDILVTRDEVKKCLLEVTTGEKADTLKKNAIKWKKVAEDAVAVGGSSQRHLDAFFEDIKKYRSLN
ncbi:unnamed protein product [Lathyrus sativus]|nr:unnamed protein product [Lathyrus sativus]